MPYADPAAQITYQQNRARARQRALRRLARLHWEHFERLFAEELARTSLTAQDDGLGADGTMEP
jgi:hypothetical protein